MEERPRRELFEFAFFRKYDDALSFLSGLAAPEAWDFEGTEKRYSILKSYLEHTFRKVNSEKEIAYTADNSYSCFNTGLVTANLEPIYAFFERNKVPQPKQAYFFRAFLKESDRQLLSNFAKYPKRANYFEHPEELIFNPNCELIVNMDHIVEENRERFPKSFQDLPNDEVIRRLEGAIQECKKRVKTNYTLAVPQYYDGRIQLLLPLNLTYSSSNPDLALAVSRIRDDTYTARTCLTLKMAYTNARLIVKPQSIWLHP